MAASHVRRPRRPGGRGPDALQRHRGGPRRLGVPPDGAARRREDLDGADARPGAQLRQGPDRPALRRVRLLPRDPGARRLARRPRDGRRLEPQDRARPRAHRDRPLRAAARPLPHRDHRRSPHAHQRGLQRAAEDARGAAAAHAVHPRLDRAPQDPARRSSRAASASRSGRSRSRRSRRSSRRSRRRRRSRPRPGALRLLAGAAEGSLRDALSLLDQAATLSGGTVDEARCAEILALVDPGLLEGMYSAIAGGDRAAAIAHLGPPRRGRRGPAPRPQGARRRFCAGCFSPRPARRRTCRTRTGSA